MNGRIKSLTLLTLTFTLILLGSMSLATSTEARSSRQVTEDTYLRWMLHMNDLQADGGGGLLEVQAVTFAYTQHSITEQVLQRRIIEIKCVLHGETHIDQGKLILNGEYDYVSCYLPSIREIAEAWELHFESVVPASNAFVTFDFTNHPIWRDGPLFAHPDFSVWVGEELPIFRLGTTVWETLPGSQMPFPATIGHFCYEHPGGYEYAAGPDCYFQIRDNGVVFEYDQAPDYFLMTLEPTTVYIGCEPHIARWQDGCSGEDTFFGGEIPLSPGADDSSFLDIDPLAHPPGGSN
jgi:hypothetical protein